MCKLEEVASPTGEELGTRSQRDFGICVPKVEPRADVALFSSHAVPDSTYLGIQPFIRHGCPELYFDDSDGITIQLADPSYRGETAA